LTTRNLVFIVQRFPVAEITRIATPKYKGKWILGTTVYVYSNNGKMMSLQLSRPQPFLAMLHEQTPQAEYLV
jgi:hypothetical protein